MPNLKRRYTIVFTGVFVLLFTLWLISQILISKDEGQFGKIQHSATGAVIAFNYPMVQVAGGTFQMGSPVREKGRYLYNDNDDECRHSVSVDAFSIGKYEVTQMQWKAVMGRNPSYFQGCDDCPVERVSWDDVQLFIQKLNNSVSDGKRYRLPKEVEWEYAARGGPGNKIRYYEYVGSDTLDNVAWYADNARNITHPVGGKLPNLLGLYDMSGNVWEWCEDIYERYPCDQKKNPAESRRVNRGGSYNIAFMHCRAAVRLSYRQQFYMDNLGFRLASSAN